MQFLFSGFKMHVKVGGEQTNMIGLLFAIVIVFALYGLLVAFSHISFFATFLLFPLILCGVIMLYADRGSEKKHSVHK